VPGDIGSPNSHDGPADGPDTDIRNLLKEDKRHEALKLLMKRYGRTVYHFCRGMVGDHVRANDIHQKVFIDAYRDLPTFAGRSLLKTWLLAIARNRSLDDIRKHNRDEARIDHEARIEMTDSGPSPGDRLDDARLRTALVECVAQLREDIRAAVLMHYQQGLTFEQIGEISGEKPGTVQARVSRAVAGLRSCIENRTGGVP
jgi:RNA polymerase sigma-70 factor (ECF subfamily)